jgi:hypothetical protein
MRAAAPHLKISLPGDDSLKTSIKRWERGTVVPGIDYRRLFQHVYGMTADQLGFPALDDRAQYQAGVQPAQLSGEALDYYGLLLNDHLRADNLLGPRYVLDLVRQQVNTLSSAAREARGPQRLPVLVMACRYHEFYGWLLQDNGRPADATIATDRARDLATELGDSSLMAYLMMRRSNIATDDNDPALAAALADSALSTHATQLPSKIRAVLLRQKANAYAGLGQADEFAAAIGEAFDNAHPAPDGSDLADYCTPGYVAMEAGSCWLDLGHPQRALEAFSQVDTQWDPALRRDHGLALAKRAAAHAGAGDVHTACTTAQDAIAIAAVTRSARTIKELQKVRTLLTQWPRDPHVDTVRRSIAGLAAA